MKEIIFSILPIICFLFGFFIGSKTSFVSGKGNEPVEIKLPTINPIKAYKEHKETEAEEKAKKELETNLHNIEVYDGTSNNQKEF